MQSKMRWILLLLAASCASHPEPKDARTGGGEVCTSVSSGISGKALEQLDHAGSAFEYENAWRTEFPSSALGTTDRAAVSARIRSRTPEVQDCYESALGKLRNGRGSVVIRFIIDSSGKVPHVTVSSNDIDDPQVGCCVVKRVAQWSFPAPAGGDFVVIEYPFVVRISGSR